MSTNAELARIFGEMSAALELTGANPFRVNAHARVARVLKDLAIDVATLADDAKKIQEIDGIGEGTAKKIIEYVKTGRVKEHDELIAQVPGGLFQVMQIPGLGPKTVKSMWEKAGVVDLASLKRALDSGELAKLPRLGEKACENIRAALVFMESAGERVRLGKALPIAELLVAELRKVKGVRQITFAGSLRRGRETIGDIDVLASTNDREALVNAFTALPEVAQVLGAGETKCSVRFHIGIQVDLRIVDDEAFGAALLYFTGSKDHNIALRERAIKRGMTLNEYGLFPLGKKKEPAPQKRGVKPVAAKTEEQIYKALELAYIPPEIREARGEVEAAAKNALPRLIERSDIKAELHTHTHESDGRMTIEEHVEQAKARGFHTLAITDHSKSSAQANGLSPERLLAHIERVHEVASGIKGVTLLAGSEVDILADGRLDYDDDLLAQLDLVIASPHASLRQEPAKATKRLLTAIRHPLVHVIGHPTGRMIGRREGLSPDMKKIIEAAIEHDVALEINSNSVRLDLRDSHVRLAVEMGAKIAINTDAHNVSDYDQLRYGVVTGRRGWLTAEQCINTWSKAKLHGWLKKKR